MFVSGLYDSLYTIVKPLSFLSYTYIVQSTYVNMMVDLSLIFYIVDCWFYKMMMDIKHKILLFMCYVLCSVVCVVLSHLQPISSKYKYDNDNAVLLHYCFSIFLYMYCCCCCCCCSCCCCIFFNVYLPSIQSDNNNSLPF